MVPRFRDPLLTEYIRDLREQYREGRVSRRELIRWGAMLGVSLPILRSWTSRMHASAICYSAAFTLP